MNAITSKTFKSGNSAAVRLPKDLGFGIGVDVTIVRSGDVITITRKRPSIQDMLRKLQELPAPGEIEVRDPDIFPDRQGL
ncbi:MAG: AbrB/MazE/SpoVT family DNA-binding domain-containing protein [Caulobacteraceae bacterium]|nr:AbrB/MazE/SpoVT family DNA-binding domain-containing protein [Caulobacter sp.]RYF93136.1 MAG: AbrB/MazE/SpoVT family DNA-binding domain-containing protein [Caulobacteraceae bacterium]